MRALAPERTSGGQAPGRTPAFLLERAAPEPSPPEIGFFHVRIVEQLLAAAGERHRTRFQEVRGQCQSKFVYFAKTSEPDFAVIDFPAFSESI